MEFGKEIFWWQTWKIWTSSTHQIFYPRRIKAKEVSIRQKNGEFILPFADGTATLSGRDYEFRESTLRREQPVRSEDLRGEIQGESGESQPAEPTDDAEARADFWSIQGDFIFRHHNEPRVLLYVPKEETCSIPPKYMNVTRLFTTQILDLLQENVLMTVGTWT